MAKHDRKALAVAGIETSPACHFTSAASSFASVIGVNGDRTTNFSTALKINMDAVSSLRAFIGELFLSRAGEVLLFYSGYGCIDDAGDVYIGSTVSDTSDSSLSIAELLSLAAASHAARKTIILDLCYSDHQLPRSLNISQPLMDPGVVLIADNRMDSEMARSQFVVGLLDALRGGAADICGDITAAGIYAYIDRVLPAHSTRPLFMACSSCFSALRTIECQVPIGTLKKIVDYFPQPETVYGLSPDYEPANAKKEGEGSSIPFSNAERIRIYKQLEQLCSIGLVEPVDSACLYFAAMDSKACHLTEMGQRYWKLIKNGDL